MRAVGLDAGTAARLAQSGRAAGRVSFYAPISGVITELEAREGVMLTPEMSAMTITELGSLWVVAEVPESQSSWVRQGTRTEVRFPSQPGEPILGRVDYVYPELNMETRTVRARIVLDAPPQDVRPDMLATVNLMAADGEAVLHVPRSAVIRNGTRDRVVVALGDGRFSSRNVVAGTEAGDRIANRGDCRKVTASSRPRSSCWIRRQTPARDSIDSMTARRRQRRRHSPIRTRHTEARS